MAFLLEDNEIALREYLLLAVNTGSAETPVWSLVGTRVESSDLEYDYSQENGQDILGNAYTTLRKPILSQSFDSVPFIGGDPVLENIYTNTRAQDISAMTNYDCLLIHRYSGTAGTQSSGASYDAERYAASAILCTSQGGEGGGYLNYGLECTFGGTRTLGSATISDAGVIAFAPAA